jgi:hypothetical protein
LQQPHIEDEDKIKKAMILSQKFDRMLADIRDKGIIYFLEGVDGGLIKIGFARNLRERIKSIGNLAP